MVCAYFKNKWYFFPRGHVKTFIHTVHLVQQLRDIPPLSVADILSSLLECEGGQGQVSSFLGSKYVLSWGLDDLLGPANSDATAAESKETNEKDKEKGWNSCLWSALNLMFQNLMFKIKTFILDIMLPPCSTFVECATYLCTTSNPRLLLVFM